MGDAWFIPSPKNKFPAIPSSLNLELDYESLTKDDILWITKDCPYILEDLSCAPPPIREVSYQSTLNKYVTQPKRMKKMKPHLRNHD